MWTNQLETMRDFYCDYFDGIASDKYQNEIKEFESYFIAFEEGARIELMMMPNIVELEANNLVSCMGLTHFSVSVGNVIAVKLLTEKLRKDGFTIASEPRTTGDGYFESVILDPDGNCVEITV